MKLSMMLNYAGGFQQSVDRVVELEKAGLDVVWIPEAYSADAISQIGYLAAKTSRVEIGTAIVNVYSRTAALMAMTAAGCDYVSNGRFILGLGASGPQVIEGFHGVPYEKPMVRIKEYIEACRMIWKREQPFQMDGQTVKVPLPAGEGTGLAKPLKIIKPGQDIRPDIPIWWASLMGLSVQATAEVADGWLPIFFDPEKFHTVWGDDLKKGLAKPLKIIKPGQEIRPDIPIWWASLMGLSVQATAEVADGWLPIFFDPEKFHTVWGDDLKKGLAKRDPSLGKLQISAGGMAAIDEKLTGDARKQILDFARPNVALYVGGMGARDKNFYNTICKKYGYEKEAIEIQDLYLSGKKDEAAAAVPAQMLENTNLVGPKSYVKERLAAYKEAGVTILSVTPVGPDAVKTIETLKELAD